MTGGRNSSRFNKRITGGVGHRVMHHHSAKEDVLITNNCSIMSITSLSWDGADLAFLLLGLGLGSIGNLLTLGRRIV